MRVIQFAEYWPGREEFRDFISGGKVMELDPAVYYVGLNVGVTEDGVVVTDYMDLPADNVMTVDGPGTEPELKLLHVDETGAGYYINVIEV